MPLLPIQTQMTFSVALTTYVREAIRIFICTGHLLLDINCQYMEKEGKTQEIAICIGTHVDHLAGLCGLAFQAY